MSFEQIITYLCEKFYEALLIICYYENLIIYNYSAFTSVFLFPLIIIIVSVLIDILIKLKKKDMSVTKDLFLLISLIYFFLVIMLLIDFILFKHLYNDFILYLGYSLENFFSFLNELIYFFTHLIYIDFGDSSKVSFEEDELGDEEYKFIFGDDEFVEKKEKEENKKDTSKVSFEEDELGDEEEDEFIFGEDIYEDEENFGDDEFVEKKEKEENKKDNK